MTPVAPGPVRTGTAVFAPGARPRGGGAVVLRTAGVAAAAAVTVVLLWEAAKLALAVPDSRMPHSWDIVGYLFTANSHHELVLADLTRNTLVTARNSVLGLICGALLGVVTGAVIARSKVVGAALRPLTVVAQTIPIVAIAPAIVLWLGTGTATKVVIATYLSFFPLTVATARGLDGVGPERRELFRVIAAGSAFTLLRLEAPTALPLVFVGLETAATFSVVGAIVAELPFGSREGLGVAILNAWQFYTIQPEALYSAALAACLLGGVVVVVIRLVRTLVPAANVEEVQG